MIRTRQTLALTRMLLRFFRRRVLNAGVLRSRAVKGVLGLVAAGLLAAASVAAYLFLAPLTGEAAVWRLLLDNATISVVLWVQVAFLFVKVLFLNAEGMLELSFHLPLTNRERSAALLAYEVAMTGVVVALGFVSLTVATLALLGPAGVPPLLVSIAIPVVLTYLGLSIAYLVLTRLFALLRLRAVQNVALVLTLFTLLVLYARSMSSLVARVSRGYLEGTDPLIWVTGVAYAARHHGFGVTVAGATLLAVALTAVVVALTPTQHVRHSRYLRVPGARVLRRVLGPYEWCVLRNSQTVLSVALTGMLFVYLVVTPLANPLWSLALLSFSGLYQFAATQPLRMIPAAATSAWRTYGRLLRAQLVLVALFAVPAGIVVAVLGADTLAGSLTAILGCVVGVTLALCIGIVFPAERDNPFSVAIGLAVSAVVVTLAAIGLGVLQLPPAGLLGALVVASTACVGFSVRAITTSNSRRRHEHQPDRRTTSPTEPARVGAAAALVRRRGPADRLDRRRSPAVPDVRHG